MSDPTDPVVPDPGTEPPADQAAPPAEAAVAEASPAEGAPVTAEAASEAPADGAVVAPPQAADPTAEPVPVQTSLIADEPLVETLPAGERPTAVDAGTDTAAPDVADLPPAEMRAVVEALLFVAPRPLSLERIKSCLPGASDEYLEGFLTGLAERYERENRGWELRQVAGGWQLLTRRALYPWVRQLERRELPSKLSKGALETLAIVAYRQPITRGAIEDIRGVQCGPVLRQLMDLKLVAVTGREEDAVGRPLIYGTTEAFLQRFGLRTTADLPRKHEFGGG